MGVIEEKIDKERVMFLLLMVFVCILPLGGVVALRNVCFFVMFVLFFFVFLKKEAVFPLGLPWLQWIVVAFASIGYAFSVNYSLSEWRVECIYDSLIFFCFATVVNSRERLMCFAIVIMLVMLLNSVGGVVLWWLDIPPKDGFYGGVDLGVGKYSTYAVIALPFLIWLLNERSGRLSRPMAVAVFFCMFFLATNLFMGKNRQVWVSIIAELLTAVFFVAKNGKLKHHVLAFGALFVMCLVVGTQVLLLKHGTWDIGALEGAVTGDDRWVIWRSCLQKALETPFFGAGVGIYSFDMKFPGVWNVSNIHHGHNFVVNKMLQMGGLGVVSFFCLLGSLLMFFLSVLRRFKGEGCEPELGVVVLSGMIFKNLTDDFFGRDVGYFFWAVMGAIVGVCWSMIRKNESNGVVKPKKILVVRKDNIGDLVCTTPLISALREKFPKAFLGALVNSYNSPVLFGNRNLDVVHVYKKAKHRSTNESIFSLYVDRLRLMLEVRRQKYDLCILANCSFSLSSFNLARQMGAKNILGFADGKYPKKENMLAYRIPYDDSSACHEVENLAKLLAPLGISGPMPQLQIFPNPILKKQIYEKVSGVFSGDNKQPVAVHISARKKYQRWPAEYFIALIGRLHRERGMSFMLFWSPGDENNPFHPGDDGKANAILAALPGVPVFPCPTHALEELVAGLSCCGSMICSDGGAMHIGAGLGLPIVCFFGNSDPVKWHPWQVPYELLQKDTRKVTDITVDEAYAAFMRLQRS